MRGRTNVIGGGVFVNGNVKEYPVASGETIGKGDFVSMKMGADIQKVLDIGTVYVYEGKKVSIIFLGIIESTTESIGKCYIYMLKNGVAKTQGQIISFLIFKENMELVARNTPGILNSKNTPDEYVASYCDGYIGLRADKTSGEKVTVIYKINRETMQITQVLSESDSTYTWPYRFMCMLPNGMFIKQEYGASQKVGSETTRLYKLSGNMATLINESEQPQFYKGNYLNEEYGIVFGSHNKSFRYKITEDNTLEKITESQESENVGAYKIIENGLLKYYGGVTYDEISIYDPETVGKITSMGKEALPKYTCFDFLNEKGLVVKGVVSNTDNYSVPKDFTLTLFEFRNGIFDEKATFTLNGVVLEDTFGTTGYTGDYSHYIYNPSDILHTDFSDGNGYVFILFSGTIDRNIQLSQSMKLYGIKFKVTYQNGVYEISSDKEDGVYLFDGEMPLIGFTKEGGTSGQTIKVYVPWGT